MATPKSLLEIDDEKAESIKRLEMVANIVLPVVTRPTKAAHASLGFAPRESLFESPVRRFPVSMSGTLTVDSELTF